MLNISIIIPLRILATVSWGPDNGVWPVSVRPIPVQRHHAIPRKRQRFPSPRWLVLSQFFFSVNLLYCFEEMTDNFHLAFLSVTERRIMHGVSPEFQEKLSLCGVFIGGRSMMGAEESSKRWPFFRSPEELYDEEYYDEQMPEKKRRLTAEQVRFPISKCKICFLIRLISTYSIHHYIFLYCSVASLVITLSASNSLPEVS